MLQRNEVEMVMMMVLMMKVMVMVMMIPMKSNSMVVTMAMISPSPGGISPADFCVPESSFLSGVLRPAAAAELFFCLSLSSGEKLRKIALTEASDLHKYGVLTVIFPSESDPG